MIPLNVTLVRQVVIWWALVALIVAFPAQSGAEAQVSGSSISLIPAQYAVNHLTPDNLSASADFQVDVPLGDWIAIRVTATIGNLMTWIQGPAGQVLNETTIATFGGTFSAFDGAQAPEGPVILPTNDPGFHYLYVFPSLGTGEYTVHFEADPGLTETVAVITGTILESPVAVSLFATGPVATVGSPVVLVAAVFEGSVAFADASVVAFVKPPTSGELVFSLLDNGNWVDASPGDGLYSWYFTPNESGDHLVVAEVHGIRSDGLEFSRVTSTVVAVVGASANFTGPVTDYGQDDNGNGLYERLVIEAEVNVVTPSSYTIQATLQTALGKTLLGHAQEEFLTTGLQTITAVVEAAELHATAENGPYTIPSLELYCDGGEGLIRSDRMLSDTLKTHPYLLEQFEPPPLDCNNNGTPDVDDIAMGSSRDCNENGVPDECDITGGTSEDCNENAVPDECDIAGGTSYDDNGNGIPDECDAKRPMPEDCATIGDGTKCGPATCTTDDDCWEESHCVPPPTGDPGSGICYAPKMRYLSIAVHPEQVPDTARRIKLDNGTVLGWVGDPEFVEPIQEPTGLWLAALQAAPHYETTWPDVVHVIGCEIAHAGLCHPGHCDGDPGVPCETDPECAAVGGPCRWYHCDPNSCPLPTTCQYHRYWIQAIAYGSDIADEGNYSEVLELRTNTTWGNTVSTIVGNNGRPPDGTVGLEDVMAAIKKYQIVNVAPITWIDIASSTGNAVTDQNIGIDDIMDVIGGYGGIGYPGNGPLNCP